MIFPVQYSKNDYKPIFKAQIHSPRLKFSNADFFINIRGYGKNRTWAENVKQTADTATILIRNKCGFDNLMRFISAGIVRANHSTKDEAKKEHTGILRAKRESYRYGSDWDGKDLYTDYERIKRYNVYTEKLDKTIENPLKNPFTDIELSVPMKSKYYGSSIKHASSNKVNSGLDLVETKYYQLLGKYKPEQVTTKNLKEIVNQIAEIRWLMAHITPWERGSDAISNVFMRALFKAFGIKASPTVKDFSFDLEAYCTNLNDYKKNFSNYFSKEIKVIE